jgi:hypothetical protein
MGVDDEVISPVSSKASSTSQAAKQKKLQSYPYFQDAQNPYDLNSD